MNRFNRFIFYVAMTLMGIVSMWTTYVSLRDSILPKPVLTLPNGLGGTWECSVFALMLSVAIGMMLFALKVAIIDEEKHLTVLGVVGLTLVGFISIAFNMDVLYRTADREFYLSYSNQQMRSAYDQFLVQTQSKLQEKQMELRKIVARQEGEMEAEIKGLRDAPAGYGPIAKQEDYKLTLMVKQAQVELENIDAALATRQKADQLLASQNPTSIDEINQLQNELRVTLKDMGVVAGVPLPNPVQMESPLFAVFNRLFDYKTVGLKEIFFLVLAFLLDLGDICGYVLVPSKRRRETVVTPVGRPAAMRPAIPVFRAHELAGRPAELMPPRVNGNRSGQQEYLEEDGYADDYPRPRPERFIPPPEEA